MKIAVIGGVASTALLVKKLREHHYSEVKVWGYAPTDRASVSGWADLEELCHFASFRFQAFERVGDCTDQIRAFGPDLVFAVGLSQLIPEAIREIPRYGCIGFHPTALPKGRGRAPIAWLVLERGDGAATFFAIGEGVDDGPILIQEPFEVGSDDDALSIESKLLDAEARALDRLLPRLRMGKLEAVNQDHLKATWYGRRKPEDGMIDWQTSAASIDRLIRASTRPHPGAFTYCQDITVIIWKARIIDRPEKGVVGRVLAVHPDNSFVVQCGVGLIHVTQWWAEPGWVLRVGQRLGYYAETEIHQLRQTCANLNQRLAHLEELLARTLPALGR